MGRRNLALDYAFRFIGIPYYWGGDDPIQGFDCSGFVIEVLQAVGLLPFGYKDIAGGLWNKWKNHTVLKARPGCLALWFQPGFPLSIQTCSHVELCLDEGYSIGSSGGGSKTITPAEAIRTNAFIKIRPFTWWGHPPIFVDPFEEVEPWTSP